MKNVGAQARSGFDIDLLDGKVKEDAFIRLLTDTRYEVKFDDYCCGRNGRPRTANIALEFRQRCRDGEVRPSGVSSQSTRADVLAVEYDDGCWFIVPMERARELARKAIAEDPGRGRWIGDGGNHFNVLVPAEWFAGVDGAATEELVERFESLEERLASHV